MSDTIDKIHPGQNMGNCSASRPLVCGNGTDSAHPRTGPPSSASALIKEKRLTMSNWRCIQTVSLCVLLLAGTARAQSSDAATRRLHPRRINRLLVRPIRLYRRAVSRPTS